MASALAHIPDGFIDFDEQRALRPLREEAMKILMVQNARWGPNSGGGRVQFELAEQLVKQGHRVEKFDFDDAFRGRSWPRPLNQIQTSIAAYVPRARRFIQTHGREFDVIDALHGLVPDTKKTLGFEGLLVARSVGLQFHYEKARGLYGGELPSHWKGTLVGNTLRRLVDRFDSPLYLRSLQRADLINVCNVDEKVTLASEFGFRDVLQLPFGLTAGRRQAFQPGAARVQERWRSKMVVFIGSWDPRKGCSDWRVIQRLVAAAVPAARFLFLGTGYEEAFVRRDLEPELNERTTIVPRFTSDQLPTLLLDGTVGAFPSYIEGFGFAVLEKLAAGLPTVAYDVSGPREMLRLTAAHNLVPVGQADALASRITEILTGSLDAYCDNARVAENAANQFQWEAIASQTAASYAAKIAFL